MNNIFIAKSGFTLIELMLVIALFAVLVAAATPIYGGWLSQARLNTAADDILSVLRVARERAASGLGNSGHGVYFSDDADGFVMYRGTSYASREEEYDLIYALDPGLEFRGGLAGVDANFGLGDGAPNADGIYGIAAASGGNEIAIIINELGYAYKGTAE